MLLATGRRPVLRRSLRRVSLRGIAIPHGPPEVRLPQNSKSLPGRSNPSKSDMTISRDARHQGTRGHAMTNTPHSGITPHCIGSTSGPDDATGRVGTIADWEASLAKLLGAAFGEGSAQANVAHVARLATMGELAASIAHEINQPLGAIASQATACLRWLKRDKPNRDRVQEGLARIERE